jgi:hypothetical protein
VNVRCVCRARLAAALFALAAPACAAPLPRDASDFVLRLRAAAMTPGGDALAAATRLPFLYEGRAHDREGFVRRVVPQLFTLALRDCLRHARPAIDDAAQFTLWCAPYGLHVRRDAAGRWLLHEFSADPEALR